MALSSTLGVRSPVVMRTRNPRASARSWIPETTAAKKGFWRSETMIPRIRVWRWTRPRAMALGR